MTCAKQLDPARNLGDQRLFYRIQPIALFAKFSRSTIVILAEHPYKIIGGSEPTELSDIFYFQLLLTEQESLGRFQPQFG